MWEALCYLEALEFMKYLNAFQRQIWLFLCQFFYWRKLMFRAIFFFFSLWSLSIGNSHSCKKKNKLDLWSSVVYQIIYFSMTRFLLLLSCWINILICTLWHLPLLFLHFKTPKQGDTNFKDGSSLRLFGVSVGVQFLHLSENTGQSLKILF